MQNLLTVAFCILCNVHLFTNALNVKLYGINYNTRKGPDWDPNKCKTPAEIDADMATLKSITNRVRIYSLVDCYQGRLVLNAAKKNGLKVWLGIWVGKSKTGFRDEYLQLESMIKDKLIDKAHVLGIHVGSEAIYRDDVDVGTSIDYMKVVKRLFVRNGIKLPVTIADIGDTYTKYPALVDAVEVVSANGFPFWEKKPVETSVAYFYRRFKPLLKMAGEKEVIVSETGWPSSGTHVNASKADPKSQALYFRDFYCLSKFMKWKVYYFSSFDESWKKKQEGKKDTVEAHFGIFFGNRTMKPWFKNLNVKCSGKNEWDKSESGKMKGNPNKETQGKGDENGQNKTQAPEANAPFLRLPYGMLILCVIISIYFV